MLAARSLFNYAGYGRTFDPRVQPNVVVYEMLLMGGYQPGTHSGIGDFLRDSYGKMANLCYYGR